MSHDKTNTIAHIGFIHKTQQCWTCKYDYFDSCTEPTESQHPKPTSTQSPPLVLNSWSQFLGNYSPEDAVNPAIDYNVTWKDGRLYGQWFCT